VLLKGRVLEQQVARRVVTLNEAKGAMTVHGLLRFAQDDTGPGHAPGRSSSIHSVSHFPVREITAELSLARKS
jgi:hypothetical protein